MGVRVFSFLPVRNWAINFSEDLRLGLMIKAEQFVKTYHVLQSRNTIWRDMTRVHEVVMHPHLNV